MPDEIRYGIIGSGAMGREHIANIQHLDGTRITAIADPDAGSRNAALEMLDGESVSVFEDHRDLLASGWCDAVVVATPNMTHAAVLADVLPSGLHVLIEKPLATTIEDCERIVAGAADHPGVVWMGLEYRYQPPVARLLEEVGAGAVGTVRMVAIREHRYPFLPKVGNWNRFRRNTGGTLVEKCCHFFDLMNLIMPSAPARVMASGGQDVCYKDESYHGETPDIIDNAFVIVDYQGGERAMLDLCMFAEGGPNEQEIAVTGDAAKVEAFVPENLFRLGTRDGAQSTEEVHDERIEFMGNHAGSSFIEHLEFRDAIRAGREADVTVDDGLRSVAMGLAAHLSIDEDRPVEIAELVG